MSEVILTFQYKLCGIMETVLNTAVREITQLVEDGFLEQVTRSKHEVDILKKNLQQWELKWKEGRREGVGEADGACVRCGCAGDSEERSEGVNIGHCVIKQEEIPKSEGPSDLPEMGHAQETATFSSVSEQAGFSYQTTDMGPSATVEQQSERLEDQSERLEEHSERLGEEQRVVHAVHVKEEADAQNEWGSLAARFRETTKLLAHSGMQRTSSDLGALTSEPQPQPPPRPAAAAWAREEQPPPPGYGIPPQRTESGVGDPETNLCGLSAASQPGRCAENQPYCCQHCSKSFTQLRNLKYHQKYHTGKKAFTCSQCGKGFVYMCHLRIHMKIHTGDRPYSCTLCGKSFIYHSNLKSHQQHHTGEKPFSCSQCGKSFSRHIYLKKHRTIHTGERPYICSHCGKGFPDRGDLKRHEQIHAR